MKIHLLFLFILCLFFQTPVNAQSVSLPYYTGFDNAAEKAGWNQFRTGFLSSFSWSNNNGSISHDYNVGGAPTQTVVDWYVSPPFDFANTAQISFKVHTSGFGQPTVDNCEVYFSSKKRDPALGTYTLIGNLSYMKPQFTWRDTSFALPFVTDSGYIAFRYKTIGAAWSVYRIDSIHIIPDPSTVSILERSAHEASFTIYPSPFTEMTTLTFAPTERATLVVYSLSGQAVRRIENISGTQLQFKREGMDPGMYFFELIDMGKQPMTGKLFVSD